MSDLLAGPAPRLRPPAAGFWRESVAIGFLLTLTLLLGSSLLAYWNTQTIVNNNARMSRKYEVIAAVELLASLIKDAETGQRGYLLTLDDQYLEPYTEAVAAIEGQLQKITQLSMERPELQPRLAGLRSKIASKLDELKQTIELTKAGNRDASNEIMRSGRGRANMEAVRDDVAAIQAEEYRLLGDRASETKASYGRAVLSIFTVALIGTALVGVVFYLIQQTLSERKQLAEILAEEKERLRVTLTSIGDAVIVTDDTGCVTFMNEVAQELTGWHAEGIGLPLPQVFHIVNEYNGEPVDNPVSKVLADGVIVGLANHTLLIHKDGSRRPIDDSAAPVRAGNELVGVVLVFRDVTERNRAEALLTDQKTVLELIVQGTPLDDVLNAICESVEKQTKTGVMTSILLANDEGTELRAAGGCKLPVPFMEALGALPIRDGAGACGTAAARSEPVIVKEIATDPLWTEYRDLALKNGLQACYSTPLISSQGEVLGTFAIYYPTPAEPTEHARRVVDILSRTAAIAVERQRTDDQLRDARSRIESTLGAGDVGTWDWEIKRNVVRGDKNLARLFNMTPQQAAAAPLDLFLQAIHVDDRPQVVQAIQNTLNDGENLEAEYRLVDPAGTVRWVIARGRVERNDAGDAVRLPGVVVEITERKRIESELVRITAEKERQRRQYDAIISATPDFAYIFSLDHKVLYANQSLLVMWGKTQAEAFGKTFLEIGYEPWHAEMHDREIDEVVATRNSLRGEVPFHGTLGKRIYDYIFVPVIGANGEVEAVAGTTRDITDRKQVEDLLRDTDRRKDEFLATLAHELRNPLAPIRNGLELMKLAGHDPHAISDARNMMERQLGQMVRLVDDLLDVSRVTKGKLELRKEPLDFATVLQSAIETSRPVVEGRQHTLTVSVPPQPLAVDGDLTRLAQVFANLLNNAAKYTDRGGQIQITATEQNGELVVSVKDNGVGIPPEMLPRVFDMFTQVDRSLERSQGGLGIGLTLVKQLVEMHGGSVEGRSAGLGQGSEFIVRLPAIPTTSVAPVPASPILTSDTRTKRRILVVDDNIDSAQTLGMLLRLMGNIIETVHDGQSAVEATATFKPDVIFLDIGLPKLNGYEVCRRVRTQGGGLKIMIIALTGWGQDEDRRKSEEAGFDAHLVKPVTRDAVEALLSGKQL